MTAYYRNEHGLLGMAAASRNPDSSAGFSVETGLTKPHTETVKKVVYLSLGSNVGDRAANLRMAIDKLKIAGSITAVSSFYETEPVEMTSQPWFLNCAVKLETEKMPRQLIAAILNLEQEMGRQRKQPKGPRTIDIDILLFSSSIVEMKGLTIPHPRMHERRFVLEPLAEIAPDARHPALKRTIRELRDSLPPGQTVKKSAV